MKTELAMLWVGHRIGVGYSRLAFTAVAMIHWRTRKGAFCGLNKIIYRTGRLAQLGERSSGDREVPCSILGVSRCSD